MTTFSTVNAPFVESLVGQEVAWPFDAALKRHGDPVQAERRPPQIPGRRSDHLGYSLLPPDTPSPSPDGISSDFRGRRGRVGPPLASTIAPSPVQFISAACRFSAAPFVVES